MLNKWFELTIAEYLIMGLISLIGLIISIIISVLFFVALAIIAISIIKIF